MRFLSDISLFILSILCCSSLLIHAQQPYAAKTTTNCSNTDNSALGYSCNGLNKSCQTYLTFRSQPPYNSVTSISTLLGSDPSQLSQINSVSETATFDTNRLVIVPVNCSCSGDYYQSNTSYFSQLENTYFLIANDTFQGLSTCQALQSQNNRNTGRVIAGESVVVPLRCACPTKSQTDAGIRYLLSYLVTWGNYVSTISSQFGVETATTLEANGLSEQNFNIYPFTTLLVPLQDPPSASQTVEPPPPPSPTSPSSPPDDSSKGSKKTWIYVLVGVVAGIAVAMIVGIIIFVVFYRKGKKRFDTSDVSESFEAYEKPLNKKMIEESQEFLESLSSIAQSMKVYTFVELQEATNNFSPSCWIKGSVYRGLFNGDFAAIKQMNGDVSKEINLLNTINHSNLIRLSGFCFNEGNWYLVYEYAANGPLSDWIYNSSNDEKFLNWRQRLQIALDVATGLNYLHSFTSPPHVHKDIKSSNILLDSEFRAKIGNLALARATEGQEGEFALTRHIIGTKGYMAPEYLENGLVSTKVDVHAFGVMMLEMITGKEVAAFYTQENVNLSDLLNEVVGEDNEEESLRQFIDPDMQGCCPLDLAILVVRLIDSCLNKNPATRPAMDEIVQSLSKILTASLTWELSSNFSTNRSFQQQHSTTI